MQDCIPDWLPDKFHHAVVLQVAAHPEAIAQAIVDSLSRRLLKGSWQGVVAAQLRCSTHQLCPAVAVLTELLCSMATSYVWGNHDEEIKSSLSPSAFLGEVIGH